LIAVNRKLLATRFYQSFIVPLFCNNTFYSSSFLNNNEDLVTFFYKTIEILTQFEENQTQILHNLANYILISMDSDSLRSLLNFVLSKTEFFKKSRVIVEVLLQAKYFLWSMAENFHKNFSIVKVNT
jgi:hypothetical protein